MVRPVTFTTATAYYLAASSVVVIWSCCRCCPQLLSSPLVAGFFRVAPLTLRNRSSSWTTTKTTSVVLVSSLLFATTATTRSSIKTTTQALELPQTIRTTRTISTPSSSSSSSSFRSHNPTNEPPMVENNNNNDTYDLGYLNAADAAALDEELMSQPGYQLEQLMELAGLAVAEAVHQVATTVTATNTNTNTGILVICGPGNNGGDGLVAARHLYMFGWTNLCIVYPALTTKVKHPHYTNLVSQCRDLGITITDTMPDHQDSTSLSQHYSIVIDAIFGFSFRGDPRPPYDTILGQLKNLNGNPNVTTVAVDVPSGWNVDDVDDKNVNPSGRYHPNVLVSLTAPKKCARSFTGRHFVGGRFLPPALAQKYNISMPPYPGVAQVMEINTHRHQSTSPTTTNTDRSWEVEYANYLAEKEREPTTLTTNQPTKLDDTTWEAQYAAYCVEKEARLAQAERRGENDHGNVESTS